MASYIIQGSTLTAMADAIRSATGTTASIRTDAFADSIIDISKEGIERGTSFTAVKNAHVSQVGRYAFAYCSTLKTVSLENCTRICYRAFMYASGLIPENIYLPKVSVVESQAFGSCRVSSTVTKKLFTNINFLPNCISLSASAFVGCSDLLTVNLPLCSSVGSAAFQSCSSLSMVSLPACTVIYSYAFQNCSKLTTLILQASSVVTLVRSNAFTNTPIATSSNAGYIYVPSSLIGSYQSATNWTNFYSKFSAIEYIN